jgi:hypothetical protein
MRKFLIALVLLCSCGDNTIPIKWEDAAREWSQAWCEWAQRCNPALFAGEFQTQEYCVKVITKYNCANNWYFCDDYYPNNEDDLEQCTEDMSTLTCKANRAPDSCYKAFSRH